MGNERTMSVDDCNDPAPASVESRWLDELPVGTIVSVEALKRWRPGLGWSSHHWLMVGCNETFDYAEYLRWLQALPPVGVIADPADPRYQRFVHESTMPMQEIA